MAVALQTQGRMMLLGKEDVPECGVSPTSCAYEYTALSDSGNGFKARQDEGLPHGVKSVIGRRPNMEDYEKVVPNLMCMELLFHEKEGLLPLMLRGQPTACKLLKTVEDLSAVCPYALDLLSSSSEDSHDYSSNNGCPNRMVQRSSVTYAAVFDGHGGSAVSAILSERLHMILKKELERQMFSLELLESTIKKCFLRMDAELGESGRTAGSTGVVSLVSRHHIIVANCGDSRGVLWRGNELVRLTRDHKPSHPDEEARIVKAGGRVCNYNGIRVMGLLAMSRAFGDHCLSEFGIIAEPEVTIIERAEDDDFMILASDGLWDVVSDAEACALTSRCFARAQERSVSKDTAARVAANVLTRVALDKGSSDNITVIVLDLRVPK